MNHVNTLRLVGKFFCATLALMITLTSFPVAEKIIKKDKNPAEISINNAEQLAVKPDAQTGTELTSSEALDVELINEIRLKKDQTTDRMERAQNRRKIQQRQQVAKVKEQIRSRSFHKSRDRRRIPDVSNPFKIDVKSTRESRTSMIYSDTILEGVADSIYILVNGVNADTITQGDDIVVTIHFSASSTEADVGFWLDMNANGTWEDTDDFDVDEGDHIVDNDEEDENPADGVYQITFYGDDEEGLSWISNLGLLLVAEDAGGSDAAFLYIEPIETDYSVSGTVTPAMANIMVMAFPMHRMGPGMDPGMGGDPEDEPEPRITMTDTSGHYQNFLPDSGFYAIFSFDFLGVTGGWIPDTTYFEVFVDGHLTGFDFDYIAPNAWIEGVVTDEDGDPLDSVVVWANQEKGPGTWTETDSTGHYTLGVLEGYWWVGLDNEDLIPDYLVPWDEYPFVTVGDTVNVDFTAYATDATISGIVFLNDFPIGGVGIGADCIFGWTDAWSEFNSIGSYTLSVTSAADDEGGYFVFAWDLPQDVFVEEYYEGIRSGSMGIDFYLHSVFGGIEGIVRDAQTQDPISDAWVGAWDGESWFGTGTDPDGFYHLALPNGTYEVDAGADRYYPLYVGTVLISDDFLVLDISLEPVSFNGSLSGFVYDSDTGLPIEDADVDVGSEDYWDHTHTDTAGYYHFPLPNGEYWAAAWKEGYAPDYTDSLIVIADNDVVHNFFLAPIVIDAAIEGVVFDSTTGQPIIGAFVSAYSEIFFAETVTGSGGYFFFEVPSNTFWLDVFAEGYEPEFIELFVATEETVSVEIGLLPRLIRSPVITSINDVPNDQGRQVRITWLPGDPSDYGIWQKFSIWRQVHDSDLHLWDFITEIPFHGLEEYSYVAPTLNDSNATTGLTDEFWSVFMVTAHTFDPWTFFDSEPEWGYSIDNLEPSEPGGLLASVSTAEVVLQWLPNPEEDLDYYTIYRGTNSGFEPAEPFSHTIDTVFVDSEIESDVTYFYVVTATDFNGNESNYSVEVGGSLGIYEIGQIPTRFELAQNYPNPFNPSTTIQFDLPNNGTVLLSIYNLLGKEINTVVNREFQAGRYRFEWDGTNKAGKLVPSGVYFYRISVDGNEYVETRKMMLLR
ncbi:MAG: carboxypeptidase regulatory-like domain-containing protein [Candidatus Marinimicrobia bacterium]|nr:carboxypeptidase regulatory-like domain-containing protein [Candidatus Neomarinimicrobiota bacterium]